MPNYRQTARRYGSYFVTDPTNPRGLGLEIKKIERNGLIIASATFSLGEPFEGPPGHVHGGVTATILDELMGQAVWMNGYKALLATMSDSYYLPVPLHTPLTAQAWITERDGKKIYTAGHLLLEDEREAVASTGLYIDVPHFFKSSGNTAGG